MHISTLALALLALSLTLACASHETSASANATGPEALPAPPRAPEIPERLEIHGDVRIDEYYGLRNRDDPRVIEYLEAENAYTQAATAHLAPLREALYREMVGRLKEDDQSVPYRYRGNWYYTRTRKGAQYPIHCRRRGSLDAPEEVLIDENELARGHEGYFDVGRTAVSPDGNLLAFAVDTVGRRFYTIRFRDLVNDVELADRLVDVTGNLVWANDGRTVFYTRQDPVTLRSYQVYRHVLGTDPAEDTLVFQEDDETFRCYLRKSKDERFVLIGISQTMADEWRYLDADRPEGEFRVLLPRRRGHEHSVEPFGDHWYFVTNDGARNFRVVRAPLDRPTPEAWEELLPGSEDVLVQSIDVFRDFLVVRERSDGLTRLRVRRWDGAGEHFVAFDEPAYSIWPSQNREVDTDELRFVYSSLTTPPSTYAYDMRTRGRTLLKREEVGGGYDPALYRTERIWAPAPDGVRVPISLVYRRDARRPGGNPCLLYGYGSYGASMDAGFRSDIISLLDRGFVYAIAHVRGGSELGRHWYEDGRLLKKKNTFTDFIACAEHLVESGYADRGRLFAMGGSAGGLLMGAVANMRPDLFRGIVAQVPFVDVVTTMLDDDIPLTTAEFDEWGDPKDPEFYRYILSYSPYDNVRAQAYPHMLVTTGLWDSQVQYWEPAKWVARLRAKKTDDHLLLLKTNMEAGHGGRSGRYRRYEDTAFVYAFLIDLAERG